MDTQCNNLALNNQKMSWPPEMSLPIFTPSIPSPLRSAIASPRVAEREDILSKNKVHSSVGAPVQSANSILASTQPAEDKPMQLE